MSLPTVPRSAASTAFARVVSLLKSNTGPLGMQGVLWVTPDDGPKWDDSLPVDRLAVRLTPELGEPAPICIVGNGVRSWILPLTVHVEVRVPTYGFSDPADLWGAIVSTLAPADRLTRPDFDAANAAAGIQRIEPMQPAAGIDPTATGTGQIRVEVSYDA